MWKIGVGYVLLLIWCYLRAELHYRRAGHAATAGFVAAPHAAAARLRVLAGLLLFVAMAVIVWGSGWNCILWLPTGFILTCLVQTLLPLRNRWK